MKTLRNVLLIFALLALAIATSVVAMLGVWAMLPAAEKLDSLPIRFIACFLAGAALTALLAVLFSIAWPRWRWRRTFIGLGAYPQKRNGKVVGYSVCLGVSHDGKRLRKYVTHHADAEKLVETQTRDPRPVGELLDRKAELLYALEQIIDARSTPPVSSTGNRAHEIDGGGEGVGNN